MTNTFNGTVIMDVLILHISQTQQAPLMQHAHTHILAPVFLVPKTSDMFIIDLLL